MARKLSETSGIVLTMVLAFIFAGLGVYVLNAMGAQANISVLVTLAEKLGNWAITWFPIILIVVAAALIIAVMLKGFGGR